MKNANINRVPKKKNSKNQTGGVCQKNLKNKALNYLSKYASTEEKMDNATEAAIIETGGITEKTMVCNNPAGFGNRAGSHAQSDAIGKKRA